VNVRLTLDEERQAVHIRTEAQTVGPTGVEMEALTGAAATRRVRAWGGVQPLRDSRLVLVCAAAAAVAGLTVYDMVKAVTKHARLTDVQLEAKSGGRSGSWSRTAG
jgi:molybdenum cofactor biosynthesis enzyme